MPITLTGFQKIVSPIPVPLRKGEFPSEGNTPQLQRKNLRFLTKLLSPEAANLPLVNRKVREADLPSLEAGKSCLNNILKQRGSPETGSGAVASDIAITSVCLEILLPAAGVKIPETIETDTEELASLFHLADQESRLKIYRSLSSNEAPSFLKALESTELLALFKALGKKERITLFFEALDRENRLALLQLMDREDFFSFLAILPPNGIKSLFKLLLLRSNHPESPKYSPFITALSNVIILEVFDSLGDLGHNELYLALTVERRRALFRDMTPGQQSALYQSLEEDGRRNLFAILDNSDRQRLYRNLPLSYRKNLFEILAEPGLRRALYFALDDIDREELISLLNTEEHIQLYRVLDHTSRKGLVKLLGKIRSLPVFFKCLRGADARYSFYYLLDNIDKTSLFRSLDSKGRQKVLPLLDVQEIKILLSSLGEDARFSLFLEIGESNCAELFKSLKSDADKLSLAAGIQNLYPKLYESQVLPWLKGKGQIK